MARLILLAIGDLADPHILAILVRSLLITLLLFAAAGIAIAFGLAGIDPCLWIGAAESCALGPSASGLGALLLIALAGWLLFPALALGVIAAHSDQIAARVEARDYPAGAARARSPGLLAEMMLGVRSSARLLCYNILALPLYLLLLLTGIGTLIAFLGVNALAIGQDLGETVASRDGDRAARRAWLRTTRRDRILIGAIVAAIFLVPLANLLAPIIGTAMMVHLFQARR